MRQADRTGIEVRSERYMPGKLIETGVQRGEASLTGA